MSLLSCLTALTLGAILLYPPAFMLRETLGYQAEIESYFLLQQNMDRALELMTRAIQGAGYQLPSSEPRSAIDEIRIQKGGFSHSADTITLTQDLPDHMEYDCMGNPFHPERTIQGRTHQRFYLEPNRQDSKTQTLMCQSVDRKGRLHHAELLSQVHALRINWVHIDNPMHSPKISQSPSGLIAITLVVQTPIEQNRSPRRIEQTRYIAQRQGVFIP